MELAITFILVYLIGAIPSGLLLTRFFGGADIRNAGSGNIGATNVYRVAGKKLGLLTLFFDALKGFLPVLCADQFTSLDDSMIAMVGMVAFLGHCYPVYLGFKGGKGVATGLGVYLYLAPFAVLGAFGIFALLLWKFRYVSLGSIAAAALLPPLAYAEAPSSWVLGATCVISLMVIWRHRANIDRLIKGTENKFKA